MQLIMPLAALGVGTLLWHRPVVAVGTLFAAALVIEANGAQFPDKIVDVAMVEADRGKARHAGFRKRSAAGAA